MKIKPGDYIATEGLTDREISEFLVAARKSGHTVRTTDLAHWTYRNEERLSPFIGIDDLTGVVFGLQNPKLFAGNARQIPWPPEPKQPSVWPRRVLTALAFIVVFTLVMFVGVVE